MGNKYRKKDDLYLWQLVKEHADADAFAELHQRFAKKLYLLAHQKTGDGEVSEDLVQDLFVVLWTGRENIHIEKGVAVYLFSALKNRIISHLRKQIVRNAMSLETAGAHLLSTHAYNDVDEQISFNELRSQYEYHCQALPEKSREAFELSRSGLTNREIAGQMNIVEKTVEFHISKCLRILKSKLI
jgi:RNA polymerase sigma-70 factor (family 1)